MKKFLKTNGYYLILIVCVFAVCIAGIAILEHKSNDDTPTLLSDNKPVSADTVPTKAPSTTSEQSSVSNGGSTSVSKPVKPSESTPQGTAEPEKLTLLKPVSGKILVEFSDKKLVYNKTLKEWKVHPAVDIAGKKGEDVKCAMTGTVTDIKNDPLYGTTIIIDNGNGTKTVYCGIGAMNDLTVGKKVTAGSVLGTLGDTIFCESETGTHLHFEVVQNGKKIDPLLLFPKETSADADDTENSTKTPNETATATPTQTINPTSTANTSQPTATSVG